ncbi:MAG: helix-turn-helix domain-containing protein [Chloroflexota bacterium]
MSESEAGSADRGLSAVSFRYLDVRELAEIFDRSPRTIRGWLQSGALPVVTVGKRRFVRSDALEAVGRSSHNDDYKSAS